MDFKDYYATLGVAKAATDAEIRKAYRKLARKHHPDLNPGDKSAEAKFKEINEANEVLGDPEKRRKYDELGANWRAHEQTPPANGPFGGGRRGGSRAMSQDEMNEMFGGQDPFSDFFNTFFAGQQAGPQARDPRGRKGRDLEETVTLTLEEAFSGTSRRASFNRAGQTRNVDIKIPAGVGEGARVRAAGEGGAASAGGKAGDLYLTVHIESHARFERRDRDLYVKMPVPVTTAILGGEIAVPTLSGSTLRLKVPELTSSGQMLRLRGHGMPAIGKPDVRGDLYATVSIVAPAALTPEMREHYTALKTLEGGQA